MARSKNDPRTSKNFRGTPVPRTQLADERTKPFATGHPGTGSGEACGWLGAGKKGRRK
jgi:hypothetical protein